MAFRDGVDDGIRERQSFLDARRSSFKCEVGTQIDHGAPLHGRNREERIVLASLAKNHIENLVNADGWNDQLLRILNRVLKETGGCFSGKVSKPSGGIDQIHFQSPSRTTSPGRSSIGIVRQPEQRGIFHANVVACWLEGFAGQFKPRRIVGGSDGGGLVLDLRFECLDFRVD